MYSLFFACPHHTSCVNTGSDWNLPVYQCQKLISNQYLKLHTKNETFSDPFNIDSHSRHRSAQETFVVCSVPNVKCLYVVVVPRTLILAILSGWRVIWTGNSLAHFSFLRLLHFVNKSQLTTRQMHRLRVQVHLNQHSSRMIREAIKLAPILSVVWLDLEHIQIH